MQLQRKRISITHLKYLKKKKLVYFKMHSDQKKMLSKEKQLNPTDTESIPHQFLKHVSTRT